MSHPHFPDLPPMPNGNAHMLSQAAGRAALGPQEYTQMLPVVHKGSQPDFTLPNTVGPLRVTEYGAVPDRVVASVPATALRLPPPPVRRGPDAAPISPRPVRVQESPKGWQYKGPLPAYKRFGIQGR